MASPILPQRTYRLGQIASGTTTQEISQIFPPDMRNNIHHLSLATAVYSASPHSQVSTVTFAFEPPLLATLPYKHGSLLSALIPNVPEKLRNIWIDIHFLGFTTLNNPLDEDQVVDIIALTGLGGKPFASWQCYDGSMWLRDHVPMDIPNCRVSLYGCPSDVGNTDSISTLSEMAQTFVMDLADVRGVREPSVDKGQRSPLFLMGHSTGGLVIKDAWCRCAEGMPTPFADLYRSISGLIFFGTPHNGMLVENILPGLAGQASENLIRDIEPGSTYIKALKQRFSRATREDLSIISCYELFRTPQSEFLPDGTIVRTGKSAMNAPESTACLYWASEVRVPIHENHSMIAKIAKRDGSSYFTIIKKLSQLVVTSRTEVPLRFHKQENAGGDSTPRQEATSSTSTTETIVIPLKEGKVSVWTLKGFLKRSKHSGTRKATKLLAGSSRRGST